MIAVLSLLIVVTLSLVITRVATVALTLTGLSSEVAKFQARSALTGSGFTTTESESVVGHPVRRRIIMTLMLVGSAGLVTAIATLGLSFVGSTAGEVARNIALLVSGLALLYFGARSKPVDRLLQRLIRWALDRFTDLDTRDYANLLQVHGDYAVSELEIRLGDWLAGRTLADTALSDEGVLVLGVQRPGGYDGAPRGDTRIHAGDILILYGPGRVISDLDVRPSGPAGIEHREQMVQEAKAREGRDDGTASAS